MSRIKIVKEGVDKDNISLSDLTSDCMWVTLESGRIDIVQAQQMVQIFNEYYDEGKMITSIEYTGGRLNPKLTQPRVE